MLTQVSGTGFAPGTVIVPTSGAPRFISFYHALSDLQVPAGTRVSIGSSADICVNMNILMDEAIGDWVFILGDDHTFDPDALLRLLRHRLPAIVGLNVQRQPPYWPVLLQGAPGSSLKNLSWDDIPTGRGLWYPAKDMYPGNAGMLIQMDVIQRLEKPIFRAGQFTPGIVNEDIWLMHSLKQLGVPVPIDLSVCLGHSANLTAKPILTETGWRVQFDYSRGKTAFKITPKSP